MLEGQYKNPVRVVAFNTAEKWSQDVSADIAQELRQRCDLQLRDVPFFLQDFVDRMKAGTAMFSFRHWHVQRPYNSRGRAFDYQR